MPKPFDLRRSAQLAVLATCVFIASPTTAQTIPAQSQTPPGAEIERRPWDTNIDLKIGGMALAPTGSETVRLKIDEIVLDGGFAPVSDQTKAFLPVSGSEISLADLYALASRVQQAYAAAGYPLVRVFVPTQDLNRAHASVRLQIVSGYVGEVRTETLDPRIRSVVARYLAPLIGQDNLSAGALERAVLLAGDVAGVELSTALSPGSGTGETILIVGGRFRRVQAVLSFDNRLAPELGREQATFSAAFNNTLGIGERIGVTMASALDTPSLSSSALRRYGGLFVDLPIGHDGLALSANAAFSTARPRGAVAFLALDNDFEHFGGRVFYPLVRTRNQRLGVFGSFEANRETQASLLLGFPVPLSRDQTRVGRVGLNGHVRTRGGLLAAVEIEYSRGFDVFDARRASDATILEPLSRIGADAVFDKVVGQVSLDAVVPGTPLTARLALRGQTGFGDALVRSEQMSVAAPDLISGPPSGILAGDRALGGRFQTEATIAAGNWRLAPYGFVAKARTWLEHPTPFELAETDADAVGAGVSAQVPLGPFLLSALVEYSHTNSNDRNVAGDWITFQVSLRF